MKEPVSKCPLNGTLIGHQRTYPELPVLYGIFHKTQQFLRLSKTGTGGSLIPKPIKTRILVASLECKTILSQKFLPFKMYLFNKLSMRGPKQ